MSFDWLDYLDLASKLRKQAGSSKQREADLRSSISRAYYATYHKSRQYVTNRWKISLYGDGRAHKQVAQEFGTKKQHTIKSDLDRMRAYRQRADYLERGGNLERTAQDTINRAMQVISDLGSV